ncbi:hypothetical protein ENSA5_51230 [Enhygromyxa salina]|uniref:Lipoprotein n=1 Tax=Enhygromyxa salina TaxID=215803 RepID=A0A2S9XH24_9BACT|nr:hypothetical protein [Enhygromyxa salina]PRP92176.1 hypothetical protein ENSA5_51230 [Enhygromyxa salina]
MSHPRTLVFALLIVSMPACKGADSTPEAAQTAGKQAPVAAEPAAAEPAEAGAATSAAVEPEAATETGTETGEDQAPLPESFEEVGVDVCDQYVKDYVACIEAKVPETEREAQRRVVFDNVESWKQTAAGGASAAKGLQTACRIAREQAKRATQDWGCEW